MYDVDKKTLALVKGRPRAANAQRTTSLPCADQHCTSSHQSLTQLMNQSLKQADVQSNKQWIDQ